MKTLPETVTLRQALEELLEVTRQRVADDVRAPATLEMQEAHARWWLAQLGDLELHQVDELVLEQLASRRPARAAHQRPPAGPNTLRKRLSTLRAALDLQHRRRRIQRVPALPKVLPRPARPKGVLESVQDARRLFEALPRHRAEWFWLALWTGQHAADVERMTWGDVVLRGKRPSMLIRNSKNRRREGLRVWMPGPLAEVLREAWERERPSLSNSIVRPWPSRWHTLTGACRKLGLPPLNATALRHTCLSWIVRRLGITPAACAFAGHSSPEMMARRYAHVLPPQANEVTEALESMADEKPEEAA